MTTGNPVTVDAHDLDLAFEFVSSGRQYENKAYVSVETGRIDWVSDMVDLDEPELPDDLEDDDLYIALPHRNEPGPGAKSGFRIHQPAPPRRL
jgi:hypothetical protein